LPFFEAKPEHRVQNYETHVSRVNLLKLKNTQQVRCAPAFARPFLSEKRESEQEADVLGKQRAKCLPTEQEKYISRSTLMVA
jgi:hypothetical protein